MKRLQKYILLSLALSAFKSFSSSECRTAFGWRTSLEKHYNKPVSDFINKLAAQKSLAMTIRGDMLKQGLVFDENAAEAMSSFMQASLNGGSWAQVEEAAMILNQIQAESENLSSLINELQGLAQANKAEFYEKIKILKENLASEKSLKIHRALSLITAAAKKGNLTAQLLAVWMFEQGIGAPADSKKASEWLEAFLSKAVSKKRDRKLLLEEYKGTNSIAKLLENHYPSYTDRALFIQGWLHNEGLIFKQDHGRALKIFASLASERNFPEAKREQAIALLKGGGGRSKEEAFNLIRQAKEKEWYSHILLAWMYQEGIGTPKDLVKAAKLMKKMDRSLDDSESGESDNSFDYTMGLASGVIIGSAIISP